MKTKLLIFLFLLASLNIFGQRSVTTLLQKGNELQISLVATSLDSGVVYSDEFELNQFDASLSTYPAAYAYNVDTLSASGEKVGIYIQGAMDGGSFRNVDTLRKTLEITDASDSINVSGLANFNTNVYVFPRYRLKIEATHDPGNPFNVKAYLYFYKRD